MIHIFSLIGILLIGFVSFSFACDYDHQGKLRLKLNYASGQVDRDGAWCDESTGCDIYVDVYINDERLYRTWKVYDSSLAMFETFVPMPAFVCDTDVIRFKMFDHDYLSPDDPMGQYSLLAKDAKGRERVEMYHLNVEYINYLDFELEYVPRTSFKKRTEVVKVQPSTDSSIDTSVDYISNSQWLAFV